MASDDPEYEDDLEYQDDPFLEDLEEELAKPEPMAFPDEYQPAPPVPVELHPPGHADAYDGLRQSKESRFPATRVARSAAELAKALRAAAAATRARALLR